MNYNPFTQPNHKTEIRLMFCFLDLDSRKAAEAAALAGSCGLVHVIARPAGGKVSDLLFARFLDWRRKIERASRLDRCWSFVALREICVDVVGKSVKARQIRGFGRKAVQAKETAAKGGVTPRIRILRVRLLKLQKLILHRSSQARLVLVKRGGANAVVTMCKVWYGKVDGQVLLWGPM